MAPQKKGFWKLGSRQQKRRLKPYVPVIPENAVTSGERVFLIPPAPIHNQEVEENVQEIFDNDNSSNSNDVEVDQNVDFSGFDDCVSPEFDNCDLYWDLDNSADYDNIFLIADFCKELRLICQTGITRNTLTKILKLLRSQIPQLKQLPKDARTLFKTPVNASADLQRMDPGYYHHFGTKVNAIRLCSQVKNVPNWVEVAVNMDGLPITKSNKKQFWPILGKVFNVKQLRSHVFVIGLYCGNGKPNDYDAFLKEFVDESNDLYVNGVNINGRQIRIRVNLLALDAPAKSAVMGVKGHNAFCGCTKCKTGGIRDERRTCFPDTFAPPRTHEEFRSQVDEDYHARQSYIVHLKGFDLVKDVPLDYMHLVCLGNVKKLLGFWIKGPQKNKMYKLSGMTLNEISGDLNMYTSMNHIPRDFGRQPRGLDEVCFWKATEFRSFLLYVGPVVLLDRLKPEAYEHFMLLHTAITILISPKHCHEPNITAAENMLFQYVETFKKLYGVAYVSHNVHNLPHLAADARRFGPLDLFSCFPFENFLGILKGHLRKKSLYLQQIVNRINEENFYPAVSDEPLQSLEFKASLEWSGVEKSPVKVNSQFKVLTFSKFSLKSNSQGEAWCGLSDGAVVKVESILCNDENNLSICGRQLTGRKSFYTKPLKSKRLGSHIFSGLSELKIWPVEEIDCKYVVIPRKNHFFALPLQHTYLRDW